MILIIILMMVQFDWRQKAATWNWKFMSGMEGWKVSSILRWAQKFQKKIKGKKKKAECRKKNCKLIWDSKRQQVLVYSFGNQHQLVYIKCASLIHKQRKRNFNLTFSFYWQTKMFHEQIKRKANVEKKIVKHK